MNQQAWIHLAVSCLAAAIWLAAYRLPLAAPRRRQRFKLAVSSATGMPPRLVFPIVGTLIYLAGAALAAAAVMLTTGPGLGDVLPIGLDWRYLPMTVLAIAGSASLTAFAMSVLYSVKPTIDIGSSVSSVGWISQILVLPVQWRWIVPMSSAALEEFFFRGVLCGGLLLAGAEPWAAILWSGLVFTVCQALLTESPLQALVLTISSIVISVVGGLLLVITGSVIPAIIMHASFAGFYTNNSGPADERSRRPAQAGRAG